MGKGSGNAGGAGALGSILGGPVGGLLGSVVGGIFGSRGQDKANKTNIMLARENRAWQERMSNTAYQRAANDLDKAGLNRILALGSPAGTPSGNVAQVQNKADAAMRSAASAAQIKNLVRQNELLTQQTRRTKAEADIKGPQAAIYGRIAKAINGVLDQDDPIGYMWNQLTGGSEDKPDAQNGRQMSEHQKYRDNLWSEIASVKAEISETKIQGKDNHYSQQKIKALEKRLRDLMFEYKTSEGPRNRFPNRK